MSEVEQRLSDDDVDFWVSDPCMRGRRYFVPAEAVRALVERAILEEQGVDIREGGNVFIWSEDAEGFPEIVVVCAPEVQA